MASGAALHEDSESYLGCMVSTRFHRVISSFLQKKWHFFRKNDKNKEKCFACFAGKMEAKIQLFYTKMIRIRSSINCKNFIKFEEIIRNGWWFPVDTPIYKRKFVCLFVFSSCIWRRYEQMHWNFAQNTLLTRGRLSSSFQPKTFTSGRGLPPSIVRFTIFNVFSREFARMIVDKYMKGVNLRHIMMHTE